MVLALVLAESVNAGLVALCCSSSVVFMSAGTVEEYLGEAAAGCASWCGSSCCTRKTRSWDICRRVCECARGCAAQCSMW